jgi:RNA polymerase sigma factor (sigma-70 family)
MVNYIKSNRYQERDDSKRDQQEYSGINALDEVDREFKKDQIIQIMDTIDPIMREVVYLYYLEQRSYSEIAEMMKVNINTIGVRIMRTRDKIKNELRL